MDRGRPAAGRGPAPYVIGVDFGTLSGRAVLANSRDGTVAAQRALAYPGGVREPAPGWALQDPLDYLAVLEGTIPPLLADAGVTGDQVAAIGWDVTACTMLPALLDGTPLCGLSEFRDEPHAGVKLWKHLAAEGQARRAEAVLTAEDPALLADYGGKVASQWMLPKILQILEEAPEVYRRAEAFLEVSDWLVLTLTGHLTRSSCFAGFKNFYCPERGYLPTRFLERLDPRLADLPEKLPGQVRSPWQAAGGLTETWAGRLHLRPGTPVAAGIIDAHAGLPGSGVTEEGHLLMSLGTSACHMVLSREKRAVPGICGVVRDSVLPGLYAYEAGQACVGDLLDWFVRQSLPAWAADAARKQGLNAHTYLSQEASRLPPGSGGLLALDWWNGQRSPYVDDRLSGLMLGMTIQTTPAQQYRALLEAAAYGARLIVETFASGGILVRQVTACGGIPRKNPLMMRIFADVLNRPVAVAGEEQAAALGSAMLAAAAAGLYPEPAAAVRAMTRPAETVYHPDRDRAAAYDRLYREYRTLAEYFARENPVMHHLKSW